MALLSTQNATKALTMRDELQTLNVEDVQESRPDASREPQSAVTQLAEFYAAREALLKIAVRLEREDCERKSQCRIVAHADVPSIVR